MMPGTRCVGERTVRIRSWLAVLCTKALSLGNVHLGSGDLVTRDPAMEQWVNIAQLDPSAPIGMLEDQDAGGYTGVPEPEVIALTKLFGNTVTRGNGEVLHVDHQRTSGCLAKTFMKPEHQEQQEQSPPEQVEFHHHVLDR